MKSKLIKWSGMVPKACGKRLTEWPILPPKMSLKIAKKWKSSIDRLLICQMWKIISGVNYWLNSDLFRPKKIVFRFKTRLTVGRVKPYFDLHKLWAHDAIMIPQRDWIWTPPLDWTPLLYFIRYMGFGWNIWTWLIVSIWYPIKVLNISQI